MNENKFIIFTDGSCIKNPGGPGGWSYIVLDANWKFLKAGFGGDRSTTNNRMEMMGVIEGLFAIDDGPILIMSDSEYVVKGINHWMKLWAEKHWPDKVKNSDLWKTVHEFASKIEIKAKWVRGHSGNPYNEQCDKLAQSARKRFCK